MGWQMVGTGTTRQMMYDFLLWAPTATRGQAERVISETDAEDGGGG